MKYFSLRNFYQKKKETLKFFCQTFIEFRLLKEFFLKKKQKEIRLFFKELIPFPFFTFNYNILFNLLFFLFILLNFLYFFLIYITYLVCIYVLMYVFVWPFILMKLIIF